MKKTLITAMLLCVGLATFAQWDRRNQYVRQIANGDTIHQRIYPTYDRIWSSNPLLLLHYTTVGVVGNFQNTGNAALGDSGDTTTVNNVLRVVGNSHMNIISPYSGTTTTFPQNISVSGNGTIRDNVYLDTCSASTYGAIYKDGVAWIHDFRPLFTTGTRPTGNNIFIGGSGNFTMAGTASTQCSNNISLGSGAMVSLSTGYGNITMGLNTLRSMSTGYYNVALGVEAGRYYGSGSSGNGTSNQSVYLGYGTRAGANGNTNETVIGSNAIGSGSNTITLGDITATTWSTTRQVTANTAGTNLLIVNGGATLGATDKGTMLSIAYGVTTGTGLGSLRLQRRSRASSTGTTDNTLTDAIIIPSSKICADNTSTTLFNVSCAAGTSYGITVEYSIKTVGGAGNESHIEVGTLYLMGGNDGAVTVTSTKVSSGQHKTDAGAYTVTFTATTANPSVISVTADSELNVSSTISYNIVNTGNQSITQL